MQNIQNMWPWFKANNEINQIHDIILACYIYYNYTHSGNEQQFDEAVPYHELCTLRECVTSWNMVMFN